MAFEVFVTDPAENDIDEAIAFIAMGSRRAAARWYVELKALVQSLSDMPKKFPVIAEADTLGFPYRSVMHYSHRVIYRVDESANAVYVVRVYHGARKPLTIPELDH